MADAATTLVSAVMGRRLGRSSRTWRVCHGEKPVSTWRGSSSACVQCGLPERVLEEQRRHSCARQWPWASSASWGGLAVFKPDFSLPHSFPLVHSPGSFQESCLRALTRLQGSEPCSAPASCWARGSSWGSPTGSLGLGCEVPRSWGPSSSPDSHAVPSTGQRVREGCCHGEV